MSEKQRKANRINGAKGGPKTPEGKAISSQNATRHGLTAHKLVLSIEDEIQFNQMMKAYNEHLQPLGIEEQDLVREVVSGKWRQERFWGIETALLELAMAETGAEIADHFDNIDPIAKTAYSLTKQYGNLKAMEMIGRAEGRMRRLHQTARKDLEKLQAARKIAPKPQRQPDPIETPDEPISFLSFLSKEEKARLNRGQNEPKSLLDLPETNPLLCD